MSPDFVGGARPASAEDAGLAELARKLAPMRPLPEAQALSEYDQWGPPLSKRRRRIRRSPSCVASRAGRLAALAILRRPKFPGSRFPVRATCVTPVRLGVGAQDAGQGRSRPQARRCCSGPRCLLRFSGLKEARPEREATSRSRPSSRSWGLRSCKLPFMLTPRLPPRPRWGPRSRRRPSWRRRRLSGRRPRRRSRRS